MKSIITILCFSVLSFAGLIAHADCHEGYVGICKDSAANPGFAWYRTDDGSIACFAIQAPAGSAPDNQRNCSPSGFAWYMTSDGYNHCYSVDAPGGAPQVSDHYCH